MINQDLKEPVDDLPIIVNASSTINKNLLYELSEETFIKQDLNTIGNINISSEGEFGIYEEYISIDNPYFELNIPYYMLDKIDMRNIWETVFTITLKNGSDFYINPKNIEKSQEDEIYYLLQEYKTNPPKKTSVSKNNIVLPNQNFIQAQQQYPQQQYPQQQYPQQQYPQQQYPQQNFQQPIYNQVPMNKKSVLVAVILHILLVGLGYAYLNKWGKFLIVLLLEIICFFTSILIIPIIIGIIIWIYVLIDTISMVGKYNDGKPY